jgi:hypothetical protein
VVSDASLPVGARASSLRDAQRRTKSASMSELPASGATHRVDTQVKAAFVFDPQRGRRARYPGEQRMGRLRAYGGG